MICALAGSILTPSDPISLFFLAIPLYLLFELGIVLLRWFPPSRIMGKEPPDAGEE
jgi:Sec-independent protein secretion pathway component TatC